MMDVLCFHYYLVLLYFTRENADGLFLLLLLW